jgi:predicted RNA-binding protein
LALAFLLLVAVVPGTSGCSGCPAALYEGVLTEQAGELVVVPEGGGAGEQVLWSDGLGVRKEGDTLVVADFFGSIKAREGDVVRLGGGEVESGSWKACGLFEVNPTAVS